MKRNEFLNLLKRKNMTAYGLARKLGYHPQTVYNWLYGHGTPSPAMMLRLMEVLDITAEEILKIFSE